MKIKDLLAAQTVIQRLNNQQMPAKLAYALAKNFRLIAQELDDFEKVRLKMLRDNWKLNEETNNFTIPPEEEEKAQKMFNDLINQEISFVPFKVDIELLEQLQLTPGETSAIDWLFFSDN